MNIFNVVSVELSTYGFRKNFVVQFQVAQVVLVMVTKVFDVCIVELHGCIVTYFLGAT